MRKLLLAATVCAALFMGALPAQATTSILVSKVNVTHDLPLSATVQTATTGDLRASALATEKGYTVNLVGSGGSCSMHANRFREAFCTIENAPAGLYELSAVPDGSRVIGEIDVTMTGELNPGYGV